MPALQQQSHRALLLLPPAPSPASYAAIKAAYHPPLFTVLKGSAGLSKQINVQLDILLPCPHLDGQLDAPRGPLYAKTQELVAGLYKLISIITATGAIDTEDAERIDTRIILAAYPRDGEITSYSSDSTPERELQGPAIDIPTLARSSRTWNKIYSVESEEGDRLMKTFQSFAKHATDVTRIRGGIVSVERSSENSTTEAGSSINHLSVAVGGTFDHLHIGHKLLLTMFAFMLGRRGASADVLNPSILTVGITGDALLVNKKYAEHLESWKRRQESTHDFLSAIVYFGSTEDGRIDVKETRDEGPNGHAVNVNYPCGLIIRYVEISDPFGPTITDKDISALVLSLETRGGGTAVNDKRKEQGWEPLEVFEVAVLDASEEDNVDDTFQSKLSSTEIRRKRSEKIQARSKA